MTDSIVGIDAGGTNVDGVGEEVFEPVAEQYVPDLPFVEAGRNNRFTDPITNLAVVAALAGFDTSHVREPAVHEPPDGRPAVDDVLQRGRRTQGECWDLG